LFKNPFPPKPHPESGIEVATIQASSLSRRQLVPQSVVAACRAACSLHACGGQQLLPLVLQLVLVLQRQRWQCGRWLQLGQETEW
jgi:hypothetical protein